MRKDRGRACARRKMDMDENKTELQPAAPQAEKTLKEQFAEEEARLTPAELERLKRAKEELMAKWLIIGGFWGAVLGALIGHFLLGTDWLTGLYTGLPLGLLAGVAGGFIFGALEKAMLLEHVGHYARPEDEGPRPE